eukprot:TRINITY_DN105468_c0_g1_i1.p1 TRINITY_DN105468_c0_g1~~TRINITY_DN105468_c0_g1_i1.p1  ORF type:complete len:259 (+),score=23.83 TRINITY_DN105468_c0_g1_i1:46-822(+)
MSHGTHRHTGSDTAPRLLTRPRSAPALRSEARWELRTQQAPKRSGDKPRSSQEQRRPSRPATPGRRPVRVQAHKAPATPRWIPNGAVKISEDGRSEASPRGVRSGTAWRAYGSFANLASSQSSPSSSALPLSSGERVRQVHAMLKEKFKRHKSSNIYHGFRNMAHYGEGNVSKVPCVYPRHLVRFVGDLGAPITEQEALKLLSRVQSAPALDKPVGMGTFHELVIARPRSGDPRFTTCHSYVNSHPLLVGHNKASGSR